MFTTRKWLEKLYLRSGQLILTFISMRSQVYAAWSNSSSVTTYRICLCTSRSYSTNSSPPFRGVRLIYRMRRFSWTISRTNLVPRHSLVPTRGRVRVGTSECLGTRDISRRGHIWSTWNIAAFHCEVSKEP